MNDSVLVEALRARDPGALAALYDSYAEGVYRYAWARLRSSDAAQVVLRDTLIAAEAHVHALADPARLRAWLYALARGECERRRAAVPLDEPDEPDEPDAPAGAPPDGPGGAGRVAVHALAGLPADEREVLDLLTRHAIAEEDLPDVLGDTAEEVAARCRSACDRLQDLVTVQVLARRTPHECPQVAELAGGRPGPPDTETRDRLLDHLDGCEICAPHRERQVSVAKVFQHAPDTGLPETLRVRVMSCFIDPELVPYRRFVARRTGLLGPDGFPARQTKGGGRRPQALAGAVAAMAIIVGAVVLFLQVRGARDDLSPTAYRAVPAPASPGAPASAVPEVTAPPAVTPPAGTPSRTPPAAPTGVVRPVAALRQGPFPGAAVPARPAPPVRAPAPTAGVPVPRQVPSPTSAPVTPPPAAPTAPTVPPAPPVTVPPAPPPVPPSGPAPGPSAVPSAGPVPTPSHQHRPVPTPCPSRTRDAAAPPAARHVRHQGRRSAAEAPRPRPNRDGTAGGASAAPGPARPAPATSAPVRPAPAVTSATSAPAAPAAPPASAPAAPAAPAPADPAAGAAPSG
ncbi:hypothetical protein Sru01_25330 [Sphaerisporangium rufum]|uniref:RNA polymerase sigma factor, sigma-70 family n=1 Tax=Sphaerisporangium rufum TaxID=1381558 RepID=A0A919R354_9ACTN|nr:sigma-70 family RNA polymerase sigma factor [Sphaerisporangium rufum]GII77551.1 hypothetical protein Sru01_25330 [Sphaerisporangium rufum]